MAAAVVAAGLCVTWPYYSVLSLVTQGGSYDSSNAGIYRLILVRIFPMLLALPFLWRRWKADHLDPLGLLLVTGTALYLGGWMTDHQTYGRAISLVVLALAVGAADGVGRSRGGVPMGRRQHRHAGRSPWGWPGCWCWVWPPPHRGGSAWSPVPCSRRRSATRAPTHARTTPTGSWSRYVSGRQVVLGTSTTDDQLIPATAGRALVPGYPQVFLDDVPARRAARQPLPGPGHQRRRAARHPGPLRPAVRAAAPRVEPGSGAGHRPRIRGGDHGLRPPRHAAPAPAHHDRPLNLPPSTSTGAGYRPRRILDIGESFLDRGHVVRHRRSRAGDRHPPWSRGGTRHTASRGPACRSSPPGVVRLRWWHRRPRDPNRPRAPSTKDG